MTHPKSNTAQHLDQDETMLLYYYGQDVDEFEVQLKPKGILQEIRDTVIEIIREARDRL